MQSIVIPKWRVLNEERKRLTNELQAKSNHLDAIKSLALSSFQAINNNDVPMASSPEAIPTTSKAKSP